MQTTTARFVGFAVALAMLGGCPAADNGDGATGGDMTATMTGQDGGTPDLQPPTTCGNHVKDGNETDVDCGGSCPKCADSKMCNMDGDCASAVCKTKMCAQASCGDGIKNGTETDVDCGGSCPKCIGGKTCAMDSDCETAPCKNSKCAIGALNFAMPVFYKTSKASPGIAAGDFNADKSPDLVVSTDDGIEVFINAGDGTFKAPVAYMIGTFVLAWQPAVADLNNDGNLDIVVPLFNTNKIVVFMGKGDGTFNMLAPFSASRGPQVVAIADMDGDKRLDLVIGLNIGNFVAVVLGNGDGTFGTPIAYDSGGANPVGVGVLDLNGDGKLDVVVANSGYDPQGTRTIPSNVATLLNSGTGKLMAATAAYTAVYPISVATGDWDGDGKTDYAVTDAMSNQVIVTLNGGATTMYKSGNGAYGLVAADFTLDGKPDLVVANSGSSSLSLFGNLGAGMWDVPVGLLLNRAAPFNVVASDFNRDGRMDIAVASRNGSMPGCYVLLNLTK